MQFKFVGMIDTKIYLKGYSMKTTCLCVVHRVTIKPRKLNKVTSELGLIPLPT